jgi:hypothetical protein
MIFLSSSNPYEIPVIEVFGTTEITGFFQNLYAILFPVMPFLMIGVAALLAGVLINVFRKIFSFDTLTGKKDEFDYDDED